MLVTCYTDASYHQRGASWAVWARSEMGRIVRAGRCPEYVHDSTAAELAAMFAGIWLVTERWQGISLLLLRSDCQAALALADGAVRGKSVAIRRLQDRIASTLQPGNIELRCSWVKGHQNPRRSTPAWLNGRCDEMARIARLGDRP